MKIKPVLFIVLLLLPVSGAAADELDIDALFEEPADELYQDDSSDDNPAESTDETEQDAKTSDNPDLVKELLKQTSISFTADCKMEAGYSPGFMIESEDLSVLSATMFSPVALFSISSILSLDLQLSTVFRTYLSQTISWPNYKWTTTEFFADYTLADSLFFRMGMQKISWGISSNFPFTDIVSRIPEDFDKSGNYASPLLGLKLNIPIGIGGIEALAFTRNGYIDNTALPKLEEIGAGIKLNLANEVFDINTGTLFHNQLHYRFFYSTKVTLFNFLEVYQEGLLANDLNYVEPTKEELEEPEVKLDNPIDLSINAGLYFDLFDTDLKLNGEYFFNGEESELDVLGSAFPLYYGHNIALNLSYDFFSDIGTIFFQGKYNITEKSGYILPALKLNPAENLQLYFALPVILGSSESCYYIDNPDASDRRLSLILLARLTGKKSIEF